jgi:pimeloyl-ACP methyl ester carboxylesterase
LILRQGRRWCPNAAKPDYIQSLADFVLSRPAHPLAAFIEQSNAVVAHDVEAQLGKITAPTQITFGRHDLVTSTRFEDGMNGSIRDSDLLIFEGCVTHADL